MQVPEFALSSYDHINHDEVRIYGDDHKFTYVSGEISDPETYRVAIVELKVGGELHYIEPAGHVAVRGFMAFPPEGATLDAHLIYEENPNREELGDLAKNIAGILMSGTEAMKLNRTNQ